MSHQIFRSINEPIRDGLTREELWEREDQGLIICWEVGRKLRDKNPNLARCAENGELPKLGFKGGINENIKKRWKYGTLNYLAEWQGLRGKDLDIDMSQEYEIFCSKTGIKVIFTNDVKKYGNA